MATGRQAYPGLGAPLTLVGHPAARRRECVGAAYTRVRDPPSPIYVRRPLLGLTHGGSFASPTPCAATPRGRRHPPRRRPPCRRGPRRGLGLHLRRQRGADRLHVQAAPEV